MSGPRPKAVRRLSRPRPGKGGAPAQRERWVPSPATSPPERSSIVSPAEAERGGVYPLDRIVEIARRYPDDVMVIPIVANTVELARKNDKHGDGTLKMRIPDSLVVNLRGDEDRRDLVFLVHIPRRLAEIGESRIVLPAEAAPLPPPPQPRRR